MIAKSVFVKAFSTPFLWSYMYSLRETNVPELVWNKALVNTLFIVGVILVCSHWNRTLALRKFSSVYFPFYFSCWVCDEILNAHMRSDIISLNKLADSFNERNNSVLSPGAGRKPFNADNRTSFSIARVDKLIRNLTFVVVMLEGNGWYVDLSAHLKLPVT